MAVVAARLVGDLSADDFWSLGSNEESRLVPRGITYNPYLYADAALKTLYKRLGLSVYGKPRGKLTQMTI
jgi:hypothetical protein